MTSKTSFEIAASREIRHTQPTPPGEVDHGPVRCPPQAEPPPRRRSWPWRPSSRGPIKGRIRVFAVPIEPLTGGCTTLLAHGDRGVKTDAASAIRPAGSPTSAQKASHDGPAAPKAAPPALWSTTRSSSKALSQPPLAHGKGGASGRRGWRTRPRPGRRSALHYALSRRVVGGARHRKHTAALNR